MDGQEGHGAVQPGNMIQRLTMDRIATLVNHIFTARNVRLDDKSVLFEYTDQDDDDITIAIGQVDSEDHLFIWLGFLIEDQEVLPAISAANIWNGNNVHVPTSCVVAADDSTLTVCLQSHLELEGGIAEDHFTAWVKGFLASIDTWEEAIFDALSEAEESGEDSSSAATTGRYESLLEGISEQSEHLWSRIEAGFTKLAPYLAEVGGVLAAAVVERLADDIRSGELSGSPRQYRGRQSSQYRQRSSKSRSSGPTRSRQQRRH